MMFSEPIQTAYDLNFRLFGFDVRTNPFFFVLPVLFGRNLIENQNPGLAIIVIAIVFWISILVHELGHTFAFRHYRIDSWIWLYWMGGLAIPGSGSRSNRMFSSFGSGYGRSLNPNQQIVVSLAGPMAGFLLAGVFCLIGVSLGAKVGWFTIIPYLVFPEADSVGMSLLQLALKTGVTINVILNLFNLLPIYPLDGGQIARQFMIKSDPWNGIRKSLILSIIVAIGAALLTYKISGGNQFGAFYFGFMAYTNFQMLQNNQ